MVSIETMYNAIRIQEKFQELCRVCHLGIAPRMKSISIYGSDASRWDYLPLTEFEVRHKSKKILRNFSEK